MKKILSFILLGLMCSIGNLWAVAASLNALPTGVSSFSTDEDNYYEWKGDKTKNTVIYDQASTPYYIMLWSNGNALVQDQVGLKIGNSSKKSAFVFKTDQTYDISVEVARNGSDMTVSLFYLGTSTDVLTDPNSMSPTGALSSVDISASSETGTLSKSAAPAGYYMVFGTLRFYAKSISITPLAPIITTQPVGASYVTGDPISPLTVAATPSAGTLTYQWYSCDDDQKTNATAIGGATSASYTPSAAGFYYVIVTDDNGSVSSDVVEIIIAASAAPTINVTSSAGAAVEKGTVVTLTAEVTGNPTPTIQWYDKYGVAIEGATELTYQPSTAVAGSYSFHALATNSVGSIQSNTINLTVNPSNACVLNQVIYSNTFDAFIKAPVAEPAANGTIKAYYLEGETVPTITSVTISEDATYAVVGSTLTVTAEDGETNAIYDITVEAVSPYEGNGKLTFDGTETWVKTGNTFSTDEGKMGWKFSKTDNDWSRERDGRTRIYFFLGPNAQVSFENGGTSRNIKVYRNGNLLNSPTSTGDCIVMGDSENAYMLAIVSNQTNGDGALKSITVDPSKFTLGANGYSTYAADFKYTVSGAEVYKAAYNEQQNAVVLTEVENAVVPAGEGIILKGTEGATATITLSNDDASDFSGNDLEGVVSATTAPADAYALATNLDGDGLTKFHPCTGIEIPANKAYIVIAANNPSAPDAIRIEFAENGATGINELEGAEKAVKFIENGKLYIQKDGVVYDATGAKVK